MQSLAVAVSSAVDGATKRISAATSHSVATAQVITGYATTSAMQWGLRQRTDHTAAKHWRSAPIGKEIMLRSAAGAERRPKLHTKRNAENSWPCFHD